jgi:hypothetical protein
MLIKCSQSQNILSLVLINFAKESLVKISTLDQLVLLPTCIEVSSFEFLEIISMPNSLLKISKVTFREEFSSQICNSYDVRSKQNGLPYRALHACGQGE